MEVPADYSLHKHTFSNGTNEMSQQRRQQFSRSSDERSCPEDEAEEEQDEEAMLYTAKHRHLLEYYEHIFEMNNRLRHRIYHVKKEINHLKQLKRLLCERLLFRRVEIIDTNLEIPDNDSGAPSALELVGEIATAAAANPSQPSVAGANASHGAGGGIAGAGGRKRKRGGTGDEQPQQQTATGGGEGPKTLPPLAQQQTTPRPKLSRGGGDEAKRNIINIIESIVADTHRANKQKTDGKKVSLSSRRRQLPPPPLPPPAAMAPSASSSLPSSTSSTICPHHPQQQQCSCCCVSSSNNSNYEPLSESDLSTEELAERLIHRRSSIDHLLPDAPEPDEDADGEEKGKHDGKQEKNDQRKDSSGREGDAVFSVPKNGQHGKEDKEEANDGETPQQQQQQQQAETATGEGHAAKTTAAVEDGRQKGQLATVTADAPSFMEKCSDEATDEKNQPQSQQQPPITAPSPSSSALAAFVPTTVSATTYSASDGGKERATEEGKNADGAQMSAIAEDGSEDDDDMEQEL